MGLNEFETGIKPVGRAFPDDVQDHAEPCGVGLFRQRRHDRTTQSARVPWLPLGRRPKPCMRLNGSVVAG